MLPFPLWYVFLVNGNQEPEIEKKKGKGKSVNPPWHIHLDFILLEGFYKGYYLLVYIIQHFP